MMHACTNETNVLMYKLVKSSAVFRDLAKLGILW